MTVMALALWRPVKPPRARHDSAAVLAVPLVSTATAVGVLLWATGGPVPALTRDRAGIRCRRQRGGGAAAGADRRAAGGRRDHPAISASIGIAEGADLAALLRHADLAMYEAKRRRSGTERFATALERDSRQRLQTSQDLDRAFERGEFVLHYQAKCDASSGAAVAVEALVRWRHPTRGLLFPDAFLGLIEHAASPRD
jgi:hypothetical protein